MVSNTGLILSSARLAAHQLVATAAIQVSPLTTSIKPVILAAPWRLKDFSFVSPIGPWRIAAKTMSGSLTSPAKLAEPSSLLGRSSLGTSWPINWPVPAGRSGTGSGRSWVAASRTSSPKRNSRSPWEITPLSTVQLSQATSQRAAAALVSKMRAAAPASRKLSANAGIDVESAVTINCSRTAIF